MFKRLYAAIYDRINRGAEAAGLSAEREGLLAQAAGRTVEIGAGTGLNLAHYPAPVTRLVLTEPDPQMVRRLRRRATVTRPDAEVIEAAAGHLPFPDDSFDTAVVTFVLCSVPDPAAALTEIARVLRPGGRLLFAEHVRSDDPAVAAKQDRPPFPYKLTGCHPNRATLDTITASPLLVEDVRHSEVPKAPRIERPMIAGIARLPETVELHPTSAPSVPSSGIHSTRAGDRGPRRRPVKTLYRASRVRSLSRPAEGEWLLVDGRHVERVGVGEPPGADRVVDLPGTVVLPGFVDAHVHLTGTTLSMIGIPIERARSAEELLGIVAEEVSHGPTKVLAHGFDESTWETRRFPTLNELDETFAMPVVLLRADGHLSLVNTEALRAAEAVDVDGVERDPEGRPTGVVRREANGAVQRWFHTALTDHELRELQLQATGLAASRGVTSVHEMAIPSSHGRREVEVLLEHRRQLPADVVVYVAEEDIPWILDLGLETIGGDLSLDGSIGARTAALTEPYADGGDSGALNADDDRVAQFFHSAHTAGLQASVHAIGDAAIEQGIRAWERVYQSLDSRQRRHFRARRHRIEHVEMVNDQMIERAAMLGLGLSVQPAFDAVWGQPGQLYEQRLGRARASTMNPFSTFVGRGLVVGGGSDSPITALDPLLGVWALENHHDASERMTREEAVYLWTSGGAALAHQEEKKGRLAPGMHADFAVYDADPMEEEDPRELRPILTVSRGREVFAR